MNDLKDLIYEPQPMVKPQVVKIKQTWLLEIATHLVKIQQTRM